MRLGYLRLVALATLAALTGCSGSHVSGADASTAIDSGTDGGVDAPDAFTPALDAGLDQDGDGIGAALDCDDTDADVGRTATRVCASACAAGIERCSDGVWGACDASTECSCDTPGMMRTVACGRCGLASQRCEDDGTWSTPGACLAEGACFEGDVETDTARCGERSRICDSSCQWRDWTVVTPPGECDPATEMTTSDGCPAFSSRMLTCSVACVWEETRACAATCTRAAAASRSGADAVCVPAGPFVLGSDDPSVHMAGRPERTVVLSEFYIDRYPVTRARYQMCIDAGVCPAPSATWLPYYEMLPMDSFAGYVPEEGAAAFCAWDGGLLVTEFQWEKAARGAHPDRRLHSWGADPADLCRVHPAPSCPDPHFTMTPTQFPDAVSPFGVRMLGALMERTSTPFQFTVNGTHAWIADGASDPTPPTAAAARVLRGAVWYNSTVYQPVNDSALRRGSATGANRYGFRCAY